MYHLRNPINFKVINEFTCFYYQKCVSGLIKDMLLNFGDNSDSISGSPFGSHGGGLYFLAVLDVIVHVFYNIYI